MKIKKAMWIALVILLVLGTHSVGLAADNRTANANATVRIIAAPKTMDCGTQHQLTAQVRMDGKAVQGASCRWSSSNGRIAVNPKTGNIRAKYSGQATITVTATLPNGKTQKASARITVKSGDPKNRVTIKAGNTVYGTYSVKKGSGEKVDIRQLAKKLPIANGTIQIKGGNTKLMSINSYDSKTGELKFANQKVMSWPICYFDYVFRVTYKWDGEVYYYYFRQSNIPKGASPGIGCG